VFDRVFYNGGRGIQTVRGGGVPGGKRPTSQINSPKLPFEKTDVL